MKGFATLFTDKSMVLLRAATALIFIIHALVRIGNGTIPRFGEYLNNKGFIIGVPLVYVITVFEILGGVTLMLGYLSRWICTGFILMLIIGIFVIHAENGWFVGEHGSGGIEYSAILIVNLMVIAISDKS